MQKKYTYTVISLICIGSLSACVSQPKVSVSKVIVPTVTSTPPPTVAEHPPVTPPVLKVITTLQPITYTQWLNQGQNQQRLDQYKNYLKQRQADFIVPDYQMLRSAREWQNCNASEYDVPPAEVWEYAVQTLKLFKTLKDQGIISANNIEVTSSYRAPYLNTCAGGAKSSSHVKNAAIDFRIGPENPTPQDTYQIQQTKVALCRFWQTQGKYYNMGVGIYESGQIHIDTLGFRTWGYNHSWRTSLCGEIIP
ncbi:D-Ala-D-Ala carboxypeptidase family metallohydrolase [Acinetobacter boissieri]|uniref:Peptidase M15 n=1 Tax=Acinetobacter boissieri TaxID=1219383 RepID=A0A1G6IBB8_9GAMM|nr:D-Ala-D-Ala carboxypeptidase family metallohydrolase [Acinetobacter boissieri]SDC03827.1 Peptidase M15 [Acinetobacter boissieri]